MEENCENHNEKVQRERDLKVEFLRAGKFEKSAQKSEKSGKISQKSEKTAQKLENSREKFEKFVKKISKKSKFAKLLNFAQKSEKSFKNLENSKLKNRNFAKIFFGGIFAFAISLSFFGGTFAQNSANISAQNSEIQNQNSENSQNYEIKKLDFINFDGESFIKTGESQAGNLKIAADFQFADTTKTTALFGARAVPNANIFAFYRTKNLFYSEFGKLSYGGSLAIPPDSNRHSMTFFEKIFTLDGKFSKTFTNTPPDSQTEIYIGAIDDAKTATVKMVGKIYSFEIWRDDVLKINLIPVARFLCNSSEVEYGFANDLDNDGNLANDEFFANSGTGKLSGSEEISPEKCAEIPEENSDENAENFAKNPDEVLVPNTGI